MLGLRTQEDKTFERFVSLVEFEAGKSKSTFFVDTQESVETIFDMDGGIECAELSGWLIPNDKVEEFRAEYEGFKDLSKWEDYVAWVTWEKVSDKISVKIKLLD